MKREKYAKGMASSLKLPIVELLIYGVDTMQKMRATIFQSTMEQQDQVPKLQKKQHEDSDRQSNIKDITKSNQLYQEEAN